MLPYPHREGQPVTYHGSAVELHDRPLQVWVCACHFAHAVERPRFMLTDRRGKVVAQHVNPRSLDAV